MPAAAAWHGRHAAMNNLPGIDDGAAEVAVDDRQLQGQPLFPDLAVETFFLKLNGEFEPI